MESFRERIAVVTGGGTGMGREIVKQLAAEGCHVAMCDVSDEAQVLAFRDAVRAAHATDCVHLVFNNAGIAGGGSFIADDRAEWERTFGVCWYGVYFCTRAFLPLLIASPDGHLVNTSSVNGFWASLGPTVSHTAYSAAKFAVKGFTEALITDLRNHAPHVKASLVMPGHVGTSIVSNSSAVLGRPSPKEMTAEDLLPIRERMKRQGLPADAIPDELIRAGLQRIADDFRDKAPLSAAGAATFILDGVRKGEWRILVGDDAHQLDQLVRATPHDAYEASFYERLRSRGIFGALAPPEP